MYCISEKMAKKTIRPLMPSMREKKKYLAFEIIADSKITDVKAVTLAIWESTLDFLGELDTAKAGLIVLEERWDSSKQRGIIKIDNKYIDHVRASLSLIDQINGQDVMVRTVGISGILKKTQYKFIAS